jgi:hypothetical protein
MGCEVLMVGEQMDITWAKKEVNHGIMELVVSKLDFSSLNSNSREKSD